MMPIPLSVMSICYGVPSAFAESVLGAYRAIFEQEQPQQTGSQQQQQQQPVPVNTDNLVGSQEADAIPGMLKTAQQAQDQADNLKEQQQKLQATADQQKQNLRDALSVASNDTGDQQNAQA